MKVRVRYFAVLRDRAGIAEELLVTESKSARSLVDEIILLRNLGLPSPLIRIAINGQFAEDDDSVNDGDEVVLIPPVAGG
ncbi:MAG: MoaD/ThiS family protein [Armatimonadetes bacterium]|nr:MoaD/ThiS family protein [Armatimonadota bacterium]